MRSLFVVGAALVMGAPVAAQQSGLDLLAMPLGARAVALGEAQTGAAGGLEALTFNPAVIAHESAAGLAFAQVSAPDLFDQYFLAVGAPAAGGVLAASVRLLTFEPIPLRSADGEPAGEFAPQAAVVGVTYARSVLSRVELGGSLKWTVLDLGSAGSDGRGSGIAADLGVLVAPFTGIPVTVGAAVLDAGPDLRLGAEPDRLPTRVRFGASAELLALAGLENRFVSTMILADREQPLADGDGGFHFGIEARVLRLVALRAGIAPAGEGVSDRRVFGLGFVHPRVRAEFAYELTGSPALENQTHVTIGLRF